MDQLDDVIADTAALLNLSNVWPQAWERQIEPLRTDLEAVEPVLSQQVAEGARRVPEVQRLREFACEELVKLDWLRVGLEERSPTPVLSTTRARRATG